MQDSKLVYVSSPYAGDIETNVENAKRYCRFVANLKHVPFAPHLHYPQFLNDHDPEERAIGMKCALLTLSKCDELWVFGDRISNGMAQEIEEAKQLGIPIMCFNSECEKSSFNQIPNAPQRSKFKWL